MMVPGIGDTGTESARNTLADIRGALRRLAREPGMGHALELVASRSSLLASSPPVDRLSPRHASVEGRNYLGRSPRRPAARLTDATVILGIRTTRLLGAAAAVLLLGWPERVVRAAASAMPRARLDGAGTFASTFALAAAMALPLALPAALLPRRPPVAQRALPARVARRCGSRRPARGWRLPGRRMVMVPWIAALGPSPRCWC